MQRFLENFLFLIKKTQNLCRALYKNLFKPFYSFSWETFCINDTSIFIIQDEEFVILLKNNEVPHTRHVRGSNYCLVNVFPDRIPGRAIIVSVVSLFHLFPPACFSSDSLLILYQRPFTVTIVCWFYYSNALLQIDNLVKGASGQALQNLNLMMGIPENTGLLYMPLFPWISFSVDPDDEKYVYSCFISPHVKSVIAFGDASFL